MHAKSIVQQFVQSQLGQMHAGRQRSLTGAVWAVMSGQFLSLSRLARGMCGSGTLKAALKRIDRYMGHERIAQEAKLVGSRLVGCMGCLSQTLVIAVDWSALGPGSEFVQLCAAISFPGMGRSIPVYQQVYPLSKLSDAKAEYALLDALREWVDEGTRVIVITDAGFRRPWFEHVHSLGWSWIGRVRRGVSIAYPAHAHKARQDWCWSEVQSWFNRAGPKAKRYTDCALSRKGNWPCEVVLIKRRHKGGKRYRRPGHGSSPKSALEARQSAHEPWLLVHDAALSALPAEQIVALYALRMQIEETFRDCKSSTYGMGQEIGRSRSALRIHALLLIATLAAFMLWHIGQLAESEGIHYRFKATTRAARELSLVCLALILCQLPHLPLSALAIHSLYDRIGVSP